METLETMKTAETNETRESSRNSPTSPNFAETKAKMSTLDSLLAVGSALAISAGIFHGCRHFGNAEFDKNSYAAATRYGPALFMAGLTCLKSFAGESPERMNKEHIWTAISGGIEGAVFTLAGYLIGSAGYAGYAASKIISGLF